MNYTNIIGITFLSLGLVANSSIVGMEKKAQFNEITLFNAIDKNDAKTAIEMLSYLDDNRIYEILRKADVWPGQTVFHKAVGKGNTRIVKEMLRLLKSNDQKYELLTKCEFFSGCSPLQTAAILKEEKDEMVWLMLDGLDSSSIEKLITYNDNGRNMPALYWALYNNHTKMVRYMTRNASLQREYIENLEIKAGKAQLIGK